MLLTIAIPTFNRCELLKKTLEQLVVCLDEEISILVIDNCSTDRTAEVVYKVIEDHPHLDIAYRRNTGNVGLSANILKCIEYPLSPWVWILGDDDMPSQDCVHTIVDKIKEHPTAFALSFETTISRNREGERQGDVISCSFSGLIENIPNFSNFLFISATVFQRERAIRYLSTGYAYTYSNAPHVAMVLEAARTEPDFLHVFAVGFVCNWAPNMRGDHWDTRNVLAALQSLVFVAASAKERAVLSKKIGIDFAYDYKWLHDQAFQSSDDFAVRVQDTITCIFVRACAEQRTIRFGYVLFSKAIICEYAWMRFPIACLDKVLMGIGSIRRIVTSAS